ncbi:hypothetical protein PVAND_007241 [Polypedilum vanderplanki]|uniref:G-protein coupled receptors family 1 profile domain-containing protein n=1 Tax=Polypedilum vanderplanki TaxID=319348 RepID=A0A9J6C6N1_POLVA|nr:hypothetical protein PVAND_007241 [Polypedilum vanderplanki]
MMSTTVLPVAINVIDDLKKHNVTEDNLNDFINLLKEYSKNTSSKLVNDTNDNCTHYCQHNIRDFFTSYQYYHGYVTLVICIFGTIANILNIIILTRKEMSKTPINSILKWLAVCDMFVMIEYIPYTYHQYIKMKGETDNTYSWVFYLEFHSRYSQILHTVSILLTVTLAIWRYIAIKHPHGIIGSVAQNHHGRAIFACFILAPVLCLPTFFVFEINYKMDHGSAIKLYFLDANEDSKLYRQLLPCIILTIISFVLIDVLCRANKRKLKLKGYNTPAGANNGHRNSKIDRRTDRTTMLLVAVLLLFLITEFPQGILGLLSGILGKCFLKRCYALFGEMMDLLALINAAIGFVLYGSMSKQFRITFKALFLRQRLIKAETTRVTNVNHTTTNV